jgi:uncharacterized protein with GYD domain
LKRTDDVVVVLLMLVLALGGQHRMRVLDELEEEDHIPMLITDAVGKSERG